VLWCCHQGQGLVTASGGLSTRGTCCSCGRLFGHRELWWCGLDGQVDLGFLGVFSGMKVLRRQRFGVGPSRGAYAQMGCRDITCVLLDGIFTILLTMTAKIPALRQSAVGACARNQSDFVSAHVTTGAGSGSFLEVMTSRITFREKVAVSVDHSLWKEGHARLWQGIGWQFGWK
jgi:hypothetical protein